MKESKLDTAIKQQVSQLYQLMQSEDLEELEIKEDDFYLHLKRKSKVSRSKSDVQVVQAPLQEAAPAPQPAQAPGLTVKSPIIGVFYRAPSPASPPFVKEGDVVNAGKTLCIVEAMKVMNEIKAEYPLRIVKILVENGKPLTAGQDLFVIEKA